MFLTILEDGGKITRFWGELTTQTHHVKLPWVSWIQKYIVGYQRNTWYKHHSSPKRIYGFNDYLYLKQKKICVAVSTNNNFKFKKSNNENQD